MRIPTNSLSDSIIGQLQQLTSRQAGLETQLSTGQRVTNPSDNPQAIGNVLNIESEKRQLVQYSSNNNLATEVSQNVYSSVSSLKTLSDKAGEISAGTSGTTSPATNTANASVVNQLIEQGLQTLNAHVNGTYLFGGNNTDTPPFSATRDASGNITGVTYNGTATAPAYQVSEGAAISPFPGGATNQHLGDFVNNLVALRNALSSQDATAVRAADPGLQTSEDNIIQTIGDNGAVQTRLEAESARTQARFSDLVNFGSRQTSADITTVTVKLSQAQTAYQAALESSAKMMSMSLLNYIPNIA